MRAVVLASLLSIALPLSAQLLSDIRVEPTDVTVFVGKTTTVTAHAILGCCSNFPWRVTFGTSSWHADAEGLLEAPRVTTEVRITGRAPGTTTLVSPMKGDGRWPLATIHVLCGTEDPVAATTSPITTVAPDRAVTLTEHAEPMAGRAFLWYRGRVGDVSQPLYATGPEIAFVPGDYGTQYVWVSAVSVCSTSAAEFRIDVVRPRRRGEVGRLDRQRVSGRTSSFLLSRRPPAHRRLQKGMWP